MRARLFTTSICTLLTLAAVAVQAQDWAGNGRAQGVVTDADQKPVEGAKVSMVLKDTGPKPILTDKKGRWAFLGLATGDWTATIEKEGYNMAQGTVHIISGAVGPGQMQRTTLNRASQAQAQPQESEQSKKGAEIRAMLERGNAALVAQNWAGARTEYETALALIEDPATQAAIQRSIASAYYGEGKVDDAVATLQKVLTLTPDDQEALRLVSSVLINSGREAEAEQYRARITGDFKIDPAVILNKGIEQYNKGAYDKALEFFQQVVAENPGNADGYYYRGMTYLATGKNAEAKADLQKVLEIDPNHARAADIKDYIANL
jgi:tetratricopeptide (TPR) repeat protein